MEFELSVTQVNNLLARVGDETPLAKRLSAHGLTNGRILIPDGVFDQTALDELWKLAEKDNDRALIFQLIALKNVREAPGHDLVVAQLENLVPALVAYFSANAIDGWIYRRNKDGVLLPWLIDGIEYVQPREGRPFVSVQPIPSGPLHGAVTMHPTNGVAG